MNIDKSIGIWNKKSTIIEDISYYLYLLDNKDIMYSKEGYFLLSGQLRFVYRHEHNNENNNYFNDALTILRKDKIDELNKINK